VTAFFHVSLFESSHLSVQHLFIIIEISDTPRITFAAHSVSLYPDSEAYISPLWFIVQCGWYAGLLGVKQEDGCCIVNFKGVRSKF
jgi:hypothetical protein